MFKELLTIFNKDTLLDRAYKRSYEMIDITSKMFREIQKRLREDGTYKLSFDVRDQDIAVNKYEREVRRNVFNHLCVAGLEDLNSGLVLVSIIIDLERVGDYTKNMVELAESHPSTLKGGKYEEDLKKIESAVADTFERVRIAFESANKAEAELLLDEYKWVNKLCDSHVNDYLNEKDTTLSAGDVVALTLYFRYLKRINSHLRNVATSVVNPFHRIGFGMKKKNKSINN